MTIRPRRLTDLAPLVSGLMAQQAETRYPFRNPLPFPVEQFLHADDAVAAWTAELDGRPVGHACRIEQPQGFPASDPMIWTCARAHGCGTDELTWISALFTTREVRGLGVGRRLLQTAVDDARAQDRRPCLEVLPVHPGAMALYLSAGWLAVGSLRPAWLREAAGAPGPDVVAMVLTDERG